MRCHLNEPSDGQGFLGNDALVEPGWFKLDYLSTHAGYSRIGHHGGAGGQVVGVAAHAARRVTTSGEVPQKPRDRFHRQAVVVDNDERHRTVRGHIDAGLGEPFLHPDEVLLEDTDFKNLFVEAMDGLEDDPAQQAAINVELALVSDWFAPFNPDRIVHPYARTEPRREFALHDLNVRLAGLTESEYDSIDWSGVDDPAPIDGMHAASEAVELARRAAGRDSTAGVWVLDPTRAEDSFGELVQATTLSEGGSGWLTWEPHDGADVVRTDGAITLTPHRHYPVGADQAWIKVSLGSRLLAVPLSAVVGYEPVPEPRRRGNDAFSELLPPA